MGSGNGLMWPQRLGRVRIRHREGQLKGTVDVLENDNQDKIKTQGTRKTDYLKFNSLESVSAAGLQYPPPPELWCSCAVNLTLIHNS